MHGTTIGRKVLGLPVRVPEQPEQIVCELGWHLVNVNPNHRGRCPWLLPREPLGLLLPDQIIERLGCSSVFIAEGRGSGNGGGGRVGGEELLDGGDERVVSARARVRVSGER